MKKEELIGKYFQFTNNPKSKFRINFVKERLKDGKIWEDGSVSSDDIEYWVSDTGSGWCEYKDRDTYCIITND